MVNKNQMLQRAIRNDLPRLIESALDAQVRQRGGTIQKAGSRITVEIPLTEENSYTYQPKQPKQVAGYRKKDGTYVDGHERQAAPITVALDSATVDVEAVISQAIAAFVTEVQRKL